MGSSGGTWHTDRHIERNGRGGCGGGWGSGGWLEGDMGDGSHTIDSVFVILKVARCEVSSLRLLLSHREGI